MKLKCAAHLRFFFLLMGHLSASHHPARRRCFDAMGSELHTAKKGDNLISERI